MARTTWIVGAVVVAAGIGGAILLTRGNGAEPKFRKEKVDRGDVVATVTASGTLSAVTTVKVGSQVSGIISRLHVDFNSEVKKGQLLAELDPTPFQATVEQRRADLEKAKVDLRNAEITFIRDKNLLEQQLISQAEFDTAKANRDGAAASVAQSEGALKQAQTNLGYTRIESPIDGVVVDRQYDIGQTVAASFQAPTLFTIAQDLTKMQVLTNIDESDIGRVNVGQQALFNVDAFPDRPFRGSVSQIRLSPQTVQNVVTYPVMLDVDNPELRLKPGMTANVKIPVERREGTLRVANAALRFRPADDALVPEAQKKAKEAAAAAKEARETGEAKRATETADSRPAREGSEAGRAPRANGDGAAPGSGGGRSAGQGGRVRQGGGARSGVVYVEVPGGKLKPVKVKTSITDGNYTAVESEELKEGDDVVVGLATLRAGEAGQRPGAVGRGPRM